MLKPPRDKRGKNMPRSNQKDNFIDQTFTILADIILKAIPSNTNSKASFSYYRTGMRFHSDGDYSSAMGNYYEALRLESDPFDRSYILYNIRLIHSAIGNHGRALEYYFAALDRNPSLTQALNNVAVLYHHRAEEAVASGNVEISYDLFDRASSYWKEAIRFSPTNYIEAQNWIIRRGRSAKS
jgi:tetratricopeptide (TPR) repeat protein